MNRLQLVKRTAIVAVVGAFFICSIFFAPDVFTQESKVSGAQQEGVQLFSFLGGKKLLETSEGKKLSIAAVSQQDIMINLQVLAPSNGLTDSESLKRLQIPLFDGETYEAMQSESKGFVQYKPGEFTWRGKIKSGDFSGDVVLTANNGAMSGLIYSPTAVYEIVPQENLTHILVELNQSLFPDCVGGLAPPKESKTGNRFSILEHAVNEQPAPKDFNSNELSDSNRSFDFDSLMADDGSQIDVMVVYSDDVRAALGGTSQARALAQQSIAVTNTAYQNSGINTSVRLVHSREITYDESPGTLSAALSWIRNNPTIAADRDTFKADMVAFIVQNASDGCGLAYVMNTVSSGFAPSAFSAVTKDCAVGNLSFPHELGHNQGMHHNPENASSSGTAFPYNYGHWVNNSFRTVMAYANPCTNFNCTRVAYFSNPSVNYNGQPTGITDQRDNSRVLNNTAVTVSNFRESCNYSISPNSANPTAAGGGASVTVTATSGCGWTAASNDAWITVTSGTPGSGNGTVTYFVDVNTGTARTGTITVAGQTFTVNQAATTIISSEADVAPRPNGTGNGSVNAGDVTQIQRFAVGLDQPFQSNEFQRADSAPRLAQDGTTLLLGNGAINTGDVTQAYRYSVGLDGLPPIAGGPTVPGGAKPSSSDEAQSRSLKWFSRGIRTSNDWLFSSNVFRNDADSAASVQATYEVRAVRESLTATTLTVAIRLDTDASAATQAASVGGTLRFDQTQLSNPTNIRLGSGAPAGTSFFANTTDVANGRLGFTINAPVNQTFPTGEQKLLLIDFTIIGTGATILSFDSSQAQRFVGDVQGNELSNSEFPPTEISLSPTSALVSVSGRVILNEGKGASLLLGRSRTTARAIVSFVDASGQIRKTQTNQLGYFRFDGVEAGYTYIFEASSKGRQFAPQVVSVNETIDNLRFVSVP